MCWFTGRYTICTVVCACARTRCCLLLSGLGKLASGTNVKAKRRLRPRRLARWRWRRRLDILIGLGLHVGHGNLHVGLSFGLGVNIDLVVRRFLIEALSVDHDNAVGPTTSTMRVAVDFGVGLFGCEWDTVREWS